MHGCLPFALLSLIFALGCKNNPDESKVRQSSSTYRDEDVQRISSATYVKIKSALVDEILDDPALSQLSDVHKKELAIDALQATVGKLSREALELTSFFPSSLDSCISEFHLVQIFRKDFVGKGRFFEIGWTDTVQQLKNDHDAYAVLDFSNNHLTTEKWEQIFTCLDPMKDQPGITPLDIQVLLQQWSDRLKSPKKRKGWFGIQISKGVEEKSIDRLEVYDKGAFIKKFREKLYELGNLPKDRADQHVADVSRALRLPLQPQLPTQNDSQPNP